MFLVSWLRALRLFGKQRPSSSTGVMGKLPAELILMILQNLPPESIIAFSLTCTVYYYAYFLITPSLDPSARETLLLLLEKDTPGVYYCHACEKLHPWSSFRYNWPSIAPLIWCSVYSFNFNSSSFDLEYSTARLVMNRHFFGPAYGLPLSTLDKDAWAVFPRTGVVVKESWRARIIEDNLILRSTYSITQWRQNADLLRSFFYKTGKHICWHLMIQDHHPDPPNVERIGILAPNSDDTYPGDGSLRSCIWCLTDYEIHTDWKSGTSRLVVYQQLGQCRSHRDWGWSGIAGDAYHARYVSHQPGFVRHRWSKGDEVTVEPEGQWAVPCPYLRPSEVARLIRNASRK